MNGIGNWLRGLGQKISYGMRSFMMGRYGTDKLNMAILGTGVVICLVSMFIKAPLVNLLLTLLSYGCMFWAISAPSPERLICGIRKTGSS